MISLLFTSFKIIIFVVYHFIKNYVCFFFCQATSESSKLSMTTDLARSLSSLSAESTSAVLSLLDSTSLSRYVFFSSNDHLILYSSFKYLHWYIYFLTRRMSSNGCKTFFLPVVSATWCSQLPMASWITTRHAERRPVERSWVSSTKRVEFCERL